MSRFIWKTSVAGCVFGLSGGVLGQHFPLGSESDPFPAGYASGDLFQGANKVELPPANGASSYTLDTRPGYVILTFQGYSTGNVDDLDLGRRGWWRDLGDDGKEQSQGNTQLGDIPQVPGNGPTVNNGIVDAVDMLLAMLQQGYDMGFRRFIINRPAGFHEDLATGVGDLPNASWWSLDEKLRDSLADDSTTDGTAGGLAWWIDQQSPAEEVTVGIYVGFRAGDPWSVFHTKEALDADKLSDTWAMYRNVNPWAEIGVTEFIFDHVGGVTDNDAEAETRSDSLHRLRAHTAFSGLHIVGEHPVMSYKYLNDDPNQPILPSGQLDEVRAEDNPWVVAANRLDTNRVDKGRLWDITNLTSEINVFFDHSDDQTLDPSRDYTPDDIADFVARGFTPWAWGAPRFDPATHDKSIELVKWVYYDMGSLLFTPSCIADLDFDGDIDDYDLDVIRNNVNQLGLPAWKGDLNRDGVVNTLDFVEWSNASNGFVPGGLPVSCP